MLVNDHIDKGHRLVFQCSHAVGASSVQINAVAFVQYNHLIVDGNLQRPFHNDVEFLPVNGVLPILFAVGKRVYLDDKRVGLASAKASGEAPILIVIAAIYFRTHALSRHVVGAHTGFFAEEKNVKVDTVSL